MSEQRIMRSFEELRYSDDFMFGKVMEGSVYERTDRITRSPGRRPDRNP